MSRQRSPRGARKKTPPRPPSPSSTALARRSPEQALRPTGSTRLEQDLAKAFELAKHSQATNTQRAYRADREHWTVYAKDCGLKPFPIQAHHLAAYIQSMNEAGLALSTIRRRCAALGKWHREQHQPSPMANDAVREVLRGLARVRRAMPSKKFAITGELVGTALIHPSFRLRDRVVLALAFVTGLRRSEVAALRWEDIADRGDQILVRVASSKTDQEGAGQQTALVLHKDPELCPVRLLRAWRSKCDPSGSVFGICDRTVANIMKRAVSLSGKDPRAYAGHSSRSGMIQTAGHDPSVPAMMVQKAARHARGDQTQEYLASQTTLDNPAFRATTRAITKPSSATRATVLASKSGSKRRRGGPAQAKKKRSKH